MNDNLSELPSQDHTFAGPLRRCFEDRSIAEMSIWFCIVAAVSLTIVLFASVGLGALVGAGDESNVTAGKIVVGGLVLWLGSLVWLWRALVRIARGRGAERLGTPVFRYMQATFLILTALTMFVRGMFFKEQAIFTLMLLAFDNVIVGMVLVFLLLAWSARCRVPWRTYGEVFGMFAMLVFEIFLVKPWNH